MKNTNNASQNALRSANERANALTKECLLEALLRLMKKKKFDQITVTELVKCAGVSRMAFYRNYSSIDQILKEHFERIVEALSASLEEEKYRNDMKLWYYDMFLFLKEHSQVLEAILEATEGQLVSIHSISKSLGLLKDNSQRVKYQYEAFSGAVRAILSEWIKNRCEGDIDLLADLCVSLQTLCS